MCYVYRIMPAALVAAALVVLVIAPGTAAAQEIRCPTEGIAASVCQAVAPLASLLLQLAGAAVGIMLIIWLIRLIH